MLVKKDENYEFAHLSFQGYLAGKEIIRTHQENLLINNWQESWWRETILLYCSQTNPNNFLKELIKIGTQEAVKLAYDCIKETPRKVNPDVEKELKEIEGKVSNLLYQPLENYLKNGEWREADYETSRVMLKIAGKEENELLWEDDIKKIPVEDLRTIDQLWLKYSNNHFGFSIQKEIWIELGGKLDNSYQPDTFDKLSDRIGWRKNGTYLSYSEHIFNTNAPLGHLPRGEEEVFVDGNRVELGRYSFLLSKL